MNNPGIDIRTAEVIISEMTDNKWCINLKQSIMLDVSHFIAIASKYTGTLFCVNLNRWRCKSFNKITTEETADIIGTTFGTNTFIRGTIRLHELRN